MRILMLAPHPSVQGPLPKHTPHLIAGLRALGCTVTSATWGRHQDVEPLWQKVRGRAGDILRVRRMLAEEAFDVMVVKTGHDWSTLIRDIALVAATRRRCRRIVVQFHGSEPERLTRAGQWPFRQASRLLLRMVDALLVLSSEEQRLWRAFDPHARVHVVRNPFVPRQEKTAVSRHEQQGGTGGPPALLFVGRLTTRKGIFDVLDALALALRQTPCRLIVAGDGPEAAAVRARADQLDIGRHVCFTGYLGGAELAAVYGQAAMLVLPTYWLEGFPTVLAEAMHAGLPIITTRIRGAADHLREGENALFVPARDPTALASAVLRLLAEPELRARMSRANRTAVGAFSPQAVACRYLEALREVDRAPAR